eukprot:scaffold10304_cov104-Isochrysis_galbana.AAC.1
MGEGSESSRNKGASPRSCKLTSHNTCCSLSDAPPPPGHGRKALGGTGAWARALLTTASMTRPLPAASHTP